MDKNEYMSGCQLRQYLHISTRKLKYLMDYNLIPHINTGHATHKYLVKLSDAQEFMRRKESEPRFMAEIYERYATPKIRKPVIIIDPTKENGKMFGKWLADKWNDVPEAIRISDAHKYTGFADKRIRQWVKNENVESVVIGSYRYMLKTSLIKHISKPEQLVNTSIQGYAELMREFKKRQSRIRENEKRREKRRLEKENKI